MKKVAESGPKQLNESETYKQGGHKLKLIFNQYMNAFTFNNVGKRLTMLSPIGRVGFKRH